MTAVTNSVFLTAAQSLDVRPELRLPGFTDSPSKKATAFDAGARVAQVEREIAGLYGPLVRIQLRIDPIAPAQAVSQRLSGGVEGHAT